MTDPPRRKRFQIHLSTAIVMMFVAGGLLWANVREQKEYFELPFVDYPVPLYAHGWPYIIVIRGFSVNVNFLQEVTREKPELNYFHACVDFAIACAILFSVWFLCEWLIRRAARKGA